MTETDMIMTIAELRGKINYMSHLLSEIKFTLKVDSDLKDRPNVKHVLDTLDKLGIKAFPTLNFDL